MVDALEFCQKEKSKMGYGNRSKEDIEVCTFIDEKKPTKTQLVDFLKKYKNVKLKGTALGKVFECCCEVDPATGISKKMTIEELVEIHPDFRTTNGSAWARTDCSYIGGKYKIERDGNPVKTVKLVGFNTNIGSRGIRPEIVKELRSRPCALTGSHVKIEIDHKNGRYDDEKALSLEKQTIDDFQPLGKGANDAKRQHCKNCKKTGKRFDARTLGFSKGWVCGDENRPVCLGCNGCFWYDIIEFRREVSK